MRRQLPLAVGGFFVACVIGTAQTNEITDAEGYDAVMKDVGATFVALQGNMEARNGPDVISGAARLAELFEQVQVFWATRGVQNAADTATTARDSASGIRSAVESQQFQSIAPANQALQGTCQSCHGEYREEVDGGGYRLKPGVL